MNVGVALSVCVALALMATGMWHQRRLEALLLRADPGELQFNARCAGCHGAGGAGDPYLGIPNLTDNDWLYGQGLYSNAGSVGDIERVIEYGIRSKHPKALNFAAMPAYGRAQAAVNMPRLTPVQMRDVVEFIVAKQGQKADAAAAARGAEIFAGTGGCYDCHSADAKGDTAIGAPNLTDHITLYGDGSRQALFDSIAYGRQGVCPAWTNRISPAGIREIALYVYSLSHGHGGR